MIETNEEIIQKLKQAICDYYMGYVKQNLKSTLINGKESEITNQIMQFLDAQIDIGNSKIVRDDIIKILNSILLDEEFETSNTNFEHGYISYSIPAVTDITIEDGSAAYLVEKTQTPFNGIEEKSCYLYVSPEYYDTHIQSLEAEIKRLEKAFSRKDFKSFEEKFNQDLSSKQYELESAKVYESASKQIELKKHKFNSITQKMINEYGKKYEEILSKDISDNEKSELANKLFEDTKSYDEKNRQAIL